MLDLQAEAAEGLGWNSRTSQPIQCRLIQNDAEDQQNFKIQELEKQLVDKNKEILLWKKVAESSRENQFRLISDLNRKNCQIDQLLTLNRIETESAIDKVFNFVTLFFGDIIAFCWFVLQCSISLLIFVMLVSLLVMEVSFLVQLITFGLAKTRELHETFVF